MNKIKHGIAILKESWTVLSSSPQIALFPVISGIASLMILALIFGVGYTIPGIREWISSTFEAITSDTEGFSVSHFLALLVLYAAYLVEYFIVIYFNTALVSCAMMLFDGKTPTLTDGVEAANKRLPQILGWTLLTGTVGYVLRLIEERLGFVGTLVIRLIGVAWSIATYFVVPVLAAEGLGPIDSVKRSAVLLKKAWGEGLTGNMGIGLVNFLFVLGVLAVGGLLTAAAIAIDMPILIFGIIALVVIAIIVGSILASALQQVFLAGLYQYAVTGSVPIGYTDESMANALVKKK